MVSVGLTTVSIGVGSQDIHAQVSQTVATLSGRVVDTAGEPLIGASILVKGSKTGTMTDIEGNFSVKCKPGTELTISYVGYKSKTVKASADMEIVLTEDSEVLDEVVVVGYGLMKKSDLTGSVSQMKGKDLMKGAPTSMEEGLRGRMSGVNVVSNDGAPGGGISIQIRGSNSFQGSTEPLYVIDGVPVGDSNGDTINFEDSSAGYNNVLSSLNPNDIASIEILKDASATAIYGSRGSNGVVLITTKSGKDAGVRDKVTLSYRSTISRPTKMIKVLSPSEYALYRNESYINTQEVSNFEWSQLDLPFPGMTNAEGKYLKGPEDFGNDSYYWQDQIFRTGITNDLNLNISGNGKGFDYAFSAGYYNQKGIVKGSDYKRYTLKTTLNKEIFTWLKFGTSTALTFGDMDAVKTATSNKNNGTEGIIRSAITYPATQTQDDLDNEYSMVAVPTNYTTALNKNKNVVVRTSNYMNVNLYKGLIYRMVLGYNYSRNDANRYFPTTLAEGKTVHGKSFAGDNYKTTLLFDNLLMYNGSFGENNISATIGTSWEDSHYYNKTVTVQGFGNDLTNGWLLGDSETMVGAKSGKWDASLFSLIGRFSYNYGGRYFITFTARKDASSKFTEGNRSSFFPSVGVSYRLSQEKFMEKTAGWLNNLKIRYSYGSSGNQGVSSYQTFAMMTGGNYPFGNSINSGYVKDPYNPGNPILTWETTWQHDAGIELELFRRLNIELDYYHKKTSDLLQKRQTAPSTGIMEILSNCGAVINEGFEASVRLRAIDTKDFILNVGGNISFNKNKVVDFGEDPMFPNSIYNSLRPYAIADGHPIGSFYGYQLDGLWRTREEVIASNQFKTQYPDFDPANPDAVTEEIIRRDWIGEYRYTDRDGDGFITDKDQTWIGDANPDFYYGFNLDLSWKNFDFGMLFQGVKGNDIFNMNALRYNNLGQTQNVPYDVYKSSFSHDNEHGTTRKIFYYDGRDGRFSRAYLEKGSYLKLRTLSLGYTFRNKIPHIEALRLSFVANNLFTITNYSGYDPEVNSFGSTPSLRGIDSGAYPQQRSFVFGADVTF